MSHLRRLLPMLAAFAVATPAFADDDEFMDFDPDAQPKGRESWTWPELAQFDTEQRVVRLQWSPKTGAPEEAISFDDVIRLERARPFEAWPDELFMLTADGRRVLVSRGMDVQAHAVLTPAIAELPVKELSPGEGHFAVAGATGRDTRFIVGGGRGLEIRAVELKDLTDKKIVKANYKPVQYDTDDDPNLEGEGGGDLERAEIEVVIKQRMGLIRRCYTRELRRNPRLQGTVKVRFVIGENGWVKYAAVRRSDLANQVVEQCIIDEMRKLKFPQPEGDGSVIVTYPFAFKGG